MPISDDYIDQYLTEFQQLGNDPLENIIKDNIEAIEGFTGIDFNDIFISQMEQIQTTEDIERLWLFSDKFIVAVYVNMDQFNIEFFDRKDAELYRINKKPNNTRLVDEFNTSESHLIVHLKISDKKPRLQASGGKNQKRLQKLLKDYII